MTYFLEFKNSARGAWKRGRFSETFTDKSKALELADSFDQHGNVVRVMETGHADGMARTIYTNLSSR